MIRAYDEALLSRAADSLGRMLDFAAHSLHQDISAMMSLFIASGAAASFERGDIRLICGMSGIELAYEVLDRSGVSFERTAPRHTVSLSPEYWCGFAMARIQWESGFSFERITASFSVQGFISEYSRKRLEYLDSLPLDTESGRRTELIRSFGRGYAEEAAKRSAAALKEGNLKESGDTPLKKTRIKNGLSQSGLAKASGVPLRTIQQYEQRQKDLCKARAEYLIMLSSALNCDPSSLLEQRP